MKKHGIPVCAVLAGMVSCARTGGKTDASEKAVEVESRRNTAIPAMFDLPPKGAKEKIPAVLMAHGHGGNKDEGGAFSALAAELSLVGIASLRMDFPGCGDSGEDFVENNRLAYMIDDVSSCREYLGNEAGIDMDRLGILGYSMGGRVAAFAATEDAVYKSVAFWSPAISEGVGDLFAFMQLNSDEDFQRLYNKAKNEGRATFNSIFGYEQTLGVDWFNDMLSLDPIERFSRYSGNVLLVTGSDDIIVPPARARRITDAARAARSVKVYNIEGADHGYGFYTGDPEIGRQLIRETVAFFKETL